MKRYIFILTIVLLLSVSQVINAQVTTSEVRVENTGGVTTISGNVGIGTTNIAADLHIGDGIGSKVIKLDGNQSKLRLLSYASQGNLWIQAGQDWNTGSVANLNFSGINGTPIHMRISSNGNVGIGTTNPTERLHVNGNIRANAPLIWPDFVFSNDYSLPTLDEVETHIKAKGHLKDIPSEAEVKANGIDLGEMDAKLLQKIEELTLYTITQQKLIEAILQEVNLMKQENKSLRNSIAHLKNK